MAEIEGIVNHLYTLASDPGNRATIVKDQGCLPGLVLFLDNPDPNVVLKSVETLEQLSLCKEIRSIMWEELGLVVSLNDIIDATGTPDSIKEIATKIISRIRPHKKKVMPATPKPTAQKRPHPSTTSRNPLSTVNEGPNGGFFKPKVNKNARTVTLQVEGLEDLHSRKTLESQLLTVKGVVSFTFDMIKARVMVRARNDVAAEDLCKVIGESKSLSAKQVVKDDDGQEVILSFGNGTEGTQSPGASKPRYLDEDEETPSAHQNDEENAGYSIALTGKAAAGVSNFFNSAASFVSKTLYW
eukprot:m.32075 g.32075  ORF g.32075 m.32075 type:complete len:299 (-) comp8376_c0_seq2:120-1016(-)